MGTLDGIGPPDGRLGPGRRSRSGGRLGSGRRFSSSVGLISVAVNFLYLEAGEVTDAGGGDFAGADGPGEEDFRDQRDAAAAEEGLHLSAVTADQFGLGFG